MTQRDTPATPAADERRLTVLFLEDETAFRQSAASWLEDKEEFEVEQVANVSSFTAALRRVKPDIALIDLMIDSEEVGFDLPAVTAEESPETVCMAITAADEEALPHYVNRALVERAGYIPFGGFVTRRMECREIAAGMRTLVETGFFVPQRLTKYLVLSRSESLTEQEKAWLQARSRGLKQQLLCKELHISTRTSERLSSRVRMKLNARSVDEAVAIALERRLILPRRAPQAAPPH